MTVKLCEQASCPDVPDVHDAVAGSRCDPPTIQIEGRDGGEDAVVGLKGYMIGAASGMPETSSVIIMGCKPYVVG